MCGSDGKTYENECELQRESCTKRKTIKVKTMTACGMYLIRITFSSLLGFDLGLMKIKRNLWRLLIRPSFQCHLALVRERDWFGQGDRLW